MHRFLVPTFNRFPGIKICRRATQIDNLVHTQQNPIPRKIKQLLERQAFFPQKSSPFGNQQRGIPCSGIFPKYNGDFSTISSGKGNFPKTQCTHKREKIISLFENDSQN